MREASVKAKATRIHNLTATLKALEGKVQALEGQMFRHQVRSARRVCCRLRPAGMSTAHDPVDLTTTATCDALSARRRCTLSSQTQVALLRKAELQAAQQALEDADERARQFKRQRVEAVAAAAVAAAAAAGDCCDEMRSPEL
jgi:hypothetical protein